MAFFWSPPLVSEHVQREEERRGGRGVRSGHLVMMDRVQCLSRVVRSTRFVDDIRDRVAEVRSMSAHTHTHTHTCMCTFAVLCLFSCR